MQEGEILANISFCGIRYAGNNYIKAAQEMKTARNGNEKIALICAESGDGQDFFIATSDKNGDDFTKVTEIGMNAKQISKQDEMYEKIDGKTVNNAKHLELMRPLYYGLIDLIQEKAGRYGRIINKEEHYYFSIESSLKPYGIRDMVYDQP